MNYFCMCASGTVSTFTLLFGVHNSPSLLPPHHPIDGYGFNSSLSMQRQPGWWIYCGIKLPLVRTYQMTVPLVDLSNCRVSWLFPSLWVSSFPGSSWQASQKELPFLECPQYLLCLLPNNSGSCPWGIRDSSLTGYWCEQGRGAEARRTPESVMEISGKQL